MMLQLNRPVVGKKGEEYVAAILTHQGFTILERNYRKRYGEIDIIALKEDLLVFVEVRSRRHAFEGMNIILPNKQRKIMLVAREFLARNNQKYADKNCRFDVAFVTKADAKPDMLYIPGAFTPDAML